MQAIARRIFQTVFSILYPPHCAGCGSDTEPGSHVCGRCMETVRKLEAPFCQQCSDKFYGAISQEFVCANCSGRNVHFECAVSAYLSRGIIRDLIHSFKYHHQLHLRHQLAEWLSDALQDPRIAGRPFDAFVPVPLHHVRRREREFNQAEVLAKLLTRRTGTPTWRALQRTRYTSTQTKLDRDERMENLRDAFRVRHTRRVKGQNLILVDDVFTTGSTVEECSRVLLRAGAASVRVITVARG